MNLQEIPNDDDLLHTAFCIYKSSDQTTALKSEQNRRVFAENFATRSALPLTTLCLKVLAHNYKFHPINIGRIQPIQLRTFYDFIDEDLPIENCINIEDEHYWKRVYSSKCRDKMIFKQKNKQRDISWKNLSITLKYIELIENTPYERWISEEMEELTKTVSPYITDLYISKLQAMRNTSFERSVEVSSNFLKSKMNIKDEENNYSDSKTTETSEYTYDFPFKDCHHVDLSILGNLLHLRSLTVEFVPPTLTRNYHNRFFNFSYVDMQNMARGISNLKTLRTMKLRRSRMDSVKFSIIIKALQSIFVEELEFYFCQLDDECGEWLYEYIVSTKSLKHLDLSGNHFKQQAIDDLSRGIKISHCKIAYLGLSNNPLSDDSLFNLTYALESYEHLKVLKLSGIQSSDIGSSGIAKLVKNNSHLIELHIIAVRMNGAGLIEALKSNHRIQQILCQGCGLTLEEEFKLEILLKRNRYIKSNPYIGDITKTEEEINAFLKRTKNPILVKTLEDKKVRTECLQRKSLRSLDASKSKSLIE